MRRLSILALWLVMVSLLPTTSEAKRERRDVSPDSAKVSGSEQEVLRDFEQILDLWRDGRYGELFERTSGGSDGKERFAAKLASAPRKPACCWEKMQEARVSLTGERAAAVRARLGFEGSVPGTVFVTRGINLKKRDGVWTISQSDLFSLADFSKKRSRYKYLPVQAK